MRSTGRTILAMRARCSSNGPSNSKKTGRPSAPMVAKGGSSGIGS
jgi:hypothetical protein